MNNKGFFDNFVNDMFTNDYMTSMEFLLRYNISAIVYYCQDFKDSTKDEAFKKVVNEFCEKIQKYSFPQLRMLEIYSAIKDAVQSDSDMSAQDLDVFLPDFIKEIKSYIADKCDVEYIAGTSCFVSTDVRYLESILLMYIRKLVTDGAEKIEITFSVESKNAVIDFSVRKISPESRVYFEDDLMNREFIINHFDKLADLWGKKINAEVIFDGNDMKIKLPLDNGTVMHSKGKQLKTEPVFNSYNIMLSDFLDS